MAIEQVAGVASGSGINVRVFQVVDINGNTVEVQACAIVDKNGTFQELLTEQTGQAVLALLSQIDTKLSRFIGALPADEPDVVAVN